MSAALSFSSVPVCAACGQSVALPVISPERLFLICGASVRRYAVMPDGNGADLYVVAVANVAHTITPEMYALYESLCRNLAVFVSEG